MFNVLLALSSVIYAFFVYIPLSCTWDWDYLVTSPCVYSNTYFDTGAYSALSAALDLWLVAVPAFIIWKLNLGKRQKMKIIVVFLTGIL